MSIVRPLEAGDIENVARLYNTIFLHRRKEPPDGLRNYMREFYLDGPFRDADIPSLVHVAGDGRISGFVGVHSVPYIVDASADGTGARRVRAAFCGSLMTEEKDRDPLAGARLLKAFLAGPQDISLSETASPVSQAMWGKLRGEVLPDYSLDWFRVLRPASFVLAAGSRRLPFLNSLGAVARYADSRLQRRRSVSGVSGFVPEPAPANLSVEAGDLKSFAEIVRRCSEGYAARPDWSAGYLEHVLDAAADKPQLGNTVIGRIRRKDGEALGGFLYYVKPGGIARVLQIASPALHYGTVLDQLLADAYRRGAAGIRGRSEPALLKASTRRSMFFAAVSASVIQTKEPQLAKPFLEGRCFMNGLAGESWNRFFGGGLV